MSQEITISRDDPPENEFFDGYSFFGPYFISCLSDYLSLTRTFGCPEEQSADGCYVQLRRNGENWDLITDHSGNRKIFFYQDGDYWAASSSLFKLGEYIRAHDRKLTINPVQFLGLHGRHSFCQQMTSRDTLFNEISLLPLGTYLQIEGDKAHVTPISAYAVPARSLRDFFTVWMPRLASLLSTEELTIRCNVSGGIDSRTVAAMVCAARDLSSPNAAKLQFNSNPRPADPRDLEVAFSLADFLNFDLVTSQEGLPSTKISPEDTFALWQNQSLGVYLPLYLQTRHFDPTFVMLSGGGGENLRPFFGDTVFSATANFIDDPLIRTAWRQSAESCASEPGATVSTIHHYRNFRNRFHSGCTAQQQIVIQPLASKHIHIPTYAGRADRQVYFDIMESCVAGVSRVPFDKMEKSPSEQNIANLSLVDVRTTHTEHANLELNPKSLSPQKRGGAGSVMSIFQQQASAVLNQEPVSLLLGNVRDEAFKFLDQFANAPQPPKGMTSLPLTKALSLGTCLDLTLR